MCLFLLVHSLILTDCSGLSAGMLTILVKTIANTNNNTFYCLVFITFSNIFHGHLLINLIE